MEGTPWNPFDREYVAELTRRLAESPRHSRGLSRSADPPQPAPESIPMQPLEYEAAPIGLREYRIWLADRVDSADQWLDKLWPFLMRYDQLLLERRVPLSFRETICW